MKTRPLTVNLTLVFIGLTALIWFIFGIIVAGKLHPALPDEPLLRWGMGISAIAAGLMLTGLGILLMKKNRLAYWVILAGLGLMSLANLFDDVGWVDFIVAVISLLPFILLLKDRNWYLSI